uniref:DAHL domain-containing protein n=1 Tax=Pseudomonas antarctica TaxID=219572 RepID=UPI0030FE9337
MKSSRLASLLTLSGIALILASVLVFLYLKSVGDQSTTYTQSRDLISQIKQLNSQWDVEVLKARIALTHNYDPLVAPFKEMSALWAMLESREAQHRHTNLADWQAAQDAYRQSFQEKARLVEQFKSHHAVLRNSLAFLPTAEDDIQAHFLQLDDADKLQQQNIATDTYDLLLSALEFAQVTSDDKAADILVGLNKLAINKQSLPAEFQVPVEILSNHITLILREQPLVNDLLDRIAAIPLSDQLDAMTTQLNHDQSAP